MGGVMVSVLALSSVDRVFNHRSRQTKNYEIIICYFSAFHTVIESKTGWLGIRIMWSREATCLQIDCISLS